VTEGVEARRTAGHRPVRRLHAPGERVPEQRQQQTGYATGQLSDREQLRQTRDLVLRGQCFQQERFIETARRQPRIAQVLAVQLLERHMLPAGVKPHFRHRTERSHPQRTDDLPVGGTQLPGRQRGLSLRSDA
jgi:hypothetical protein